MGHVYIPIKQFLVRKTDKYIENFEETLVKLKKASLNTNNHPIQIHVVSK